eukprot:712407-Hanusia_phi.AAC.4
MHRRDSDLHHSGDRAAEEEAAPRASRCLRRSGLTSLPRLRTRSSRKRRSSKWEQGQPALEPDLAASSKIQLARGAIWGREEGGGFGRRASPSVRADAGDGRAGERRGLCC